MNGRTRPAETAVSGQIHGAWTFNFTPKVIKGHGQIGLTASSPSKLFGGKSPKKWRPRRSHGRFLKEIWKKSDFKSPRKFIIIIYVFTYK